MKTKQNKNQSIIIRFAWKCRSLTCFLARPLLKLVKIPKAEVNQSHSWYKVGLPHCPFINTPLLPTLSWCFQPSIHWNVQVCRFTGTFKSVFWISTPLAEQIQWQSLSLSLKKKKCTSRFRFNSENEIVFPQKQSSYTQTARETRESAKTSSPTADVHGWNGSPPLLGTPRLSSVDEFLPELGETERGEADTSSALFVADFTWEGATELVCLRMHVKLEHGCSRWRHEIVFFFLSLSLFFFFKVAVTQIGLSLSTGVRDWIWRPSLWWRQ